MDVWLHVYTQIVAYTTPDKAIALTHAGLKRLIKYKWGSQVVPAFVVPSDLLEAHDLSYGLPN